MRTSERTAIITAFIYDASRTRGADDKEAGARYEGFGNGVVGTIPARPQDKGKPQLADVDEIKNPRTGVVVYRLSDTAKRLQAVGCEFAYPKP